jgi:hypothetical protein
MGTKDSSPGVKNDRGVTMTTHLHLVPRLRMSRSYTFLPLVSCMAVAGQLYFYLKQVFFFSSLSLPVKS